MDKQTGFCKLPYQVLKSNNGSICKLYLNDCLEGVKNYLKDNSVDVVITSPPYNIGTKYSSYNDTLPRNEYLSWLSQVGKEIERVLRDNGSFFLNIGNRPTDQWLAWDVAYKLSRHFALQNVIHWIKSIAISKQDMGKNSTLIDDIAVGHFKPIPGNRFLNNCQEYIFHFTKKGDNKLEKLSIGVPYKDKSNIGRWCSVKGDKRDRGNTWFIPYETVQAKSQRPHPAAFPVKLPKMCIRLHGLRDGLIVMDPFSGIGSTAIASRELGVSFIGFEIDQGYIDETIQRLSRIEAKNCKIF